MEGFRGGRERERGQYGGHRGGGRGGRGGGGGGWDSDRNRGPRDQDHRHYPNRNYNQDYSRGREQKQEFQNFDRSNRRRDGGDSNPRRENEPSDNRPEGDNRRDWKSGRNNVPMENNGQQFNRDRDPKAGHSSYERGRELGRDRRVSPEPGPPQVQVYDDNRLERKRRGSPISPNKFHDGSTRHQNPKTLKKDGRFFVKNLLNYNYYFH